MNEHPAFDLPGIPMLLVLFVAWIALGAWLIPNLGIGIGHDPVPAPILTSAAVAAFLLFLNKGFFQVQPNQGQVMQLFGRYSGTARDAGLRWTNPFYAKRAVSLRVRNFESGKLKVNDNDGNPIDPNFGEMAKAARPSPMLRLVRKDGELSAELVFKE